mmetsp:Transcript_81522/g.242987  ORF Transcript_81522/g.242987 Transcript_81522/m.242987 type:complete len:334 (+) Transcript_81522:112-1113(+)
MKQSYSETLLFVCLVHMLICVAFICVPTDHALELGGVLIYPVLQWVYGTFCCLSVISIITAGVGNVYNIPVHLTIYYYVLMLSALADLAWFISFLVLGQSCHTVQGGLRKSPHLMKVVTCMFNSSWALFCLIILMAFKVFAMVTTSRAIGEAVIRRREEFLPYLTKSMGHMADNDRQDAFAPPRASEWDQQTPGSNSRIERTLSFRSSAPVEHPASGAPPGTYPSYGTVEGPSAPAVGRAATDAGRLAEAALGDPAVTGGGAGTLPPPEDLLPVQAPGSQRSVGSGCSGNPFNSVIFGPGELPGQRRATGSAAGPEEALGATIHAGPPSASPP